MTGLETGAAPTELVLGVTWPGSPGTPPQMRTVTVSDRTVHYRDLPDARLGFRVVGDPGVRYCTGRIAFRRNGPPEYVACPEQDAAVSSRQCEACAAKDSFRFVHTIHRGGFVSRDLEKHVMQPHWLYVATFAGGTHKIGTAADTRKWGRLAEQGAIAATFVAWAPDGKVIRVLEDYVTEKLLVRQAVRSSAKAASLALPLQVARVRAANDATALRVRDLLSASDGLGEHRVIDEPWEAADYRSVLLTSAERLEYPLDITEGEHGFTVVGCVGQTAIVRADGELYVVDFAELKGRRIEPGQYVSRLPAVQSALF